MRTLRTLIISMTALVALAAPAGASTVVAEAKPWHYWIAPVLFLSAMGILVLLAIGYLWKVVRPQVRGR